MAAFASLAASRTAALAAGAHPPAPEAALSAGFRTALAALAAAALLAAAIAWRGFAPATAPGPAGQMSP